MRNDTSLLIWIFVLILLLSGVITLGDIFSFVFYIIGFVLLLSLIGLFILRRRVRRAQQEAEQNGQPFGGFTWHFGGHSQGTRHRNPDEGKVKIETPTGTTRKRVSDDVGEYVDFKED